MNYLIAGVFLGALYTVLAAGLVLVYRVSKVVNFSAGALGTGTAYLFWQFHEFWRWPLGVAVLAGVVCTVAASALAGVGIDRASRQFGRTPATVGAAALMLTIVGGVIWVWGAGLRQISSIVPGGDRSFALGGVRVTLHQVAAMGWGAGFAGLLSLWLRRSDLGLQLRAMGEDDEVAQLYGARPWLLAAVAWAVGGLGSGVAGLLISHIATLDPVTLTFQTVPAFVAAAAGALRHFGRAYLGAIGLGILYGVVGPWTATPGMRELIAFGLLVAILLILSARARPEEAA